MFRKREEPSLAALQPQAPIERINSVLGSGISWKGSLSGSGGLRIEGAFDGNIALRGTVVVGESGRVTAEQIRANTVIIAGMVKGNITAEKVEIRSTGRVWGDVVTVTFATEEGAFLRGQIRMEESIDLGLESIPDPTRVAVENLPPSSPSQAE